VDKGEFKVTKSGKNWYGKSVPVEYTAESGAGVSIDYAHKNEGPDAPHIGWKQAGKKKAGAGKVGHFIVDNVPAGRTYKKE